MPVKSKYVSSSDEEKTTELKMDPPSDESSSDSDSDEIIINPPVKLSKRKTIKEEETDEDEEEIKTYIDKNKLSTLPPDLLVKISSFLSTVDKVSSFTSSKKISKLRSKVEIDLSTRVINVSNLVKYAPSFLQYNIIELNTRVDNNNEKLDGDTIKLLGNLIKLTLNVSAKYNRKTLIQILQYCKSLRILQIGYSLKVDTDLMDYISTKTNLTSLDIYSNIDSPDEIPLKISKLVNLQTLILFYSKSDLDVTSFGKLINLTYLDISVDGNKIKGLEQCKSLQTLKFGIGIIENEKLLSNLQSLIYISIYESLIKEITGLSGIKTLQTVLLMEVNKLKVVNLSGCTNLKALYLKGRDNPNIYIKECLSIKEICIDCNMENLDFLRECKKLKRLVIPSSKVNNIDGILLCSQLEILTIRADLSIKNLQALTNCTKLKNLVLSGYNHIDNIEDLQNCKDITHIEIATSPITSLQGLEECVQLQSLKLGTTNVNSLLPLSKCTKLQCLSIDSLFIKNLTPLRNCTGLLSLELTNCAIKRLFPLKSCPNLLTLSFNNCTKLESLNGIERCTKLYNLFVNNCTKLEDIFGVSGCTSLTVVSFLKCVLKDILPLTKCEKLNTLTVTTDEDVINIKNLSLLKMCPHLTSITLADKTYTFNELKYIILFDNIIF